MQRRLKRSLGVAITGWLVLVTVGACATSETGSLAAATTAAATEPSASVTPTPAEAAATPETIATNVPTEAITTLTGIPTRLPTVTVTTASTPDPDPTTDPTATLTAVPTALPTPLPTAPAATPTPTPVMAVVGRVVTAREIDGLQRPIEEVSEFDLGERVYIAVEFRDVLSGAVLGVRWTTPDGRRGQFETEPQTRSVRRGFWAFFYDEADVVGEYRVDVLVNGVPEAEVRFWMRSGGPQPELGT